MRIQYFSDLHLEFEQNHKYFTDIATLPVTGDILILAGDIVPIHDEYLNNPFFRLISQNYSRIFWVPGNHEFYFGDISSYSRSFNIKIYNNINIVNNIETEIEGVNFIFTTLWSRIGRENEKNIEQCVSDFDCILNNDRKFRATDFNRLHEESLDFLKEAIKNKKSKNIVVTHHLPSHMCNAPYHKDSPLREAFCVDLTGMIETSGVNFWIYGHSHYNQKPIIIGKTILVTNQLGYLHLNEISDFRPAAYISV